MARVLIVKNITREGPGIFSEILRKNNVEQVVVDVSKGEKIPDPSGFNAMLVMGGPQSANDKTESMLHELEQVRSALKNNVPYLGVCLGMQVLVKAAGGGIVQSPYREVGWKGPDNLPFKVKLTESGIGDPLFTGLPNPLQVFHLHGETVQLKGAMELLGTGEFCTNQIVKIGNAYGLQGHFEVVPAMYAEWLKEDPDLQKISKEKLRLDYKAAKEAYEVRRTVYTYEGVGEKLFLNFLMASRIL